MKIKMNTGNYSRWKHKVAIQNPFFFVALKPFKLTQELFEIISTSEVK